EQPLGQMVRTLACAGFGGIWLDRSGYADRGAAVEGELTRILGADPLVSRNGQLCFFGLGGCAARLRRQATEAEWARARERALYPVLFSWPSGFYDLEGRPNESWRWAEDRADLVLTNRGPRARRVTLAMRCVPAFPGPAPLRVEGPLWEEELTLG